MHTKENSEFPARGLSW